MFDLTGNVAVVTGASVGLGRQFALALARQGADVAILARRKEKLAEVAKEVEALGVRCLPVGCDVTDVAQVQNAVQAVLDAFGTVDILVNNAAGFGGGKTFDRMTYEEWDRLIRINLTGAYMFTNEVLPYMVEKSSTGRSVWSARARPLDMISPIPTMRPPRAGMIGLAKELLPRSWRSTGSM